MPDWISEQYGAEAERMWKHVFEGCQENGSSNNCYEYATGTVVRHYAKSIGWQKSFQLAHEAKKSALKKLSETTLIKNINVVEEVIGRIGRSRLLLLETILRDNVFDEDNEFDNKIDQLSNEIIDDIEKLTNKLGKLDSMLDDAIFYAKD